MKRAVILILLIILAIGIFILPKKPKRLPEITKFQGKIAIVLDDWGYNTVTLPLVEKIKYPVTAAILPNLAYSNKVANELNLRGFEIILHLPMQPKEKSNLEKNTILTTMGEKEIVSIMDNDLKSVQYAKGVNNHMGSKATSDQRTMEIVFKQLKKRGFFFLDSFVTLDSVCLSLAHKMNLAILKRDVFLDNKAERSYIVKQINKLKDISKARGYAIGIGHDRKLTLEVLSEVMPELQNEGYKFVYLSELAQ